MPIYAYKCESCGHAKDVLQKMADEPLTDCPVCGKPSFKKQLTAAGFQLKGNGWYATDFKGGSSGAPATAEPSSGDGAAVSTPTTPASPTSPTSPAASPSTPAPGSAPAAAASSACAASCACH